MTELRRVAMTGGHGFLGWHTACRLRALHGIEPLLVGRDTWADPSALRDALDGVDTVIHLAGVNRAASDEEVEGGNVELAETLGSALGQRPVHVVYADSVQRELDNPYGRGKRRAAELLARLPGTFADVVLPNLFGEHGRPAYNSFVATFCSEVAAGRRPEVTGDREIPLLHAQGAAQALIGAALDPVDRLVPVEGEPHGIGEVLDRLTGFQALYAERGELPDLSTSFAVDLFNTYRSYLFPGQFPIAPSVHGDARGDLVETVRAHGGTGQGFVSTTRPGHTRGDHYHLRKVERFFVLAGEAEISLRRLLHDDVVTFRLSGDTPSFVDMPTMWVHNIRNVGDRDLLTMFWADQLLDADQPDQYPEKVTP
ncbi:NAD-dependent epimerase/dehydratase family protein [Nocardioides cynanchi]|uniref:polysaccharide biosynthesis C-terminal domain-containing protein n=1 Tax=Nocardioides cynanchi TaxID=2558918 RepID=UPI001246BE21|nr:NAD-dependent epimerase/dehydratase family protein [Nocardioides cynanchi]